MAMADLYVPMEWRLAICFCFVDVPPVVDEDLLDSYRPRLYGGFDKMPVQSHPLRQQISQAGRMILGSSAKGSKIEVIFADHPCARLWPLLREPGRVYIM